MMMLQQATPSRDWSKREQSCQEDKDSCYVQHSDDANRRQYYGSMTPLYLADGKGQNPLMQL